MKTNLTYVKKSYGVNPKQKFVKCMLEFEVNLDKIPGIHILEAMPEYEEFINTLTYCGGVKFFDEDSNGNYSEHGVLVFNTESIAYCSPVEEFNEELGRKLALTRAQKQAFQEVSNLYVDLYEMVSNATADIARLACSTQRSAYKCKIHEHELTGHEMISYC